MLRSSTAISTASLSKVRWWHRPLSSSLSLLLLLESDSGATTTPCRPMDASDFPPTVGRGDFGAFSSSSAALSLFLIAPVAWKLRNRRFSKNESGESLTPLKKEQKQNQEP
jgi:hypothetical protein